MAFLLLFIGLPLVEFFLLVQVGARIGFLPTLFLVLGTGLVGASLARQQGMGVLARMQTDLAAGRQPSQSALEAVVILISGVLLLAPGFLTDALGVLGLLPPTRLLILHAVQRSLEKAVKEGRVVMGGRGPGGGMFFSGRFGAPGSDGDGSASAGPRMFGGSFRGPATGGAGGGIRDATVVAERDGPADSDPDDDSSGDERKTLRDAE